MDIILCNDTSDAVIFYKTLDLYLKPIATINISIQLPSTKLIGKTISNKVIIDKIKTWAAPDVFCSLKVLMSTLEFVRFEGEVLNKSKVQGVLARLDGKIFKLPGLPNLKMRASITKPDFPSKHDWDSFFRDAKHMNEMKAGERPDTIYISNVPSEWFYSKRDRPSESLVKKCFEQFGEVTCVDIPSNDPYRHKMKSSLSGLKMFSDLNGSVFEVYIQFKDYMTFINVMDTLRGMKLMLKTTKQSYTANIKIDFDKSKHLSENSIRKRKIERDRLILEEREKEEHCNNSKENETSLKNSKMSADYFSKVASKEERLKRREEKRKAKELKKLRSKEVEDLNKKIASEEHLLLLAQRKLEAIRLLTELLSRIKEKQELQDKESKRNERIKSISGTGIKKSDLEDKVNIQHDHKVKEVYKKDDLVPYYDHKFTGSSNLHSTRGRGSRMRGRRPWNSRGNQWRTTPGETFIPAQIYYGATHDLYYRYFNSISKNSHSRSPERRRHRSRSRSRSGSASKEKSRHQRDLRDSSRERVRSRDKSRDSYKRKKRSESKTRNGTKSSSKIRSRSR